MYESLLNSFLPLGETTEKTTGKRLRSGSSHSGFDQDMLCDLGQVATPF